MIYKIQIWSEKGWDEYKFTKSKTNEEVITFLCEVLDVQR